MSHEIRTPMNAVIGLLELALEDSRSGRCDTQTLQTAHDSAIGLLELIGDILDISHFPIYDSNQKHLEGRGHKGFA